MKQSDLEREIRDVVETTLAHGDLPRANWLTHEIVASHHPDGAEFPDFDRLCAYGHVRATLRNVIRRYKTVPDEEVDPQIVLPGFERLQRAYLVEREIEGEVTQIPVPLDQMNGEEILAKVSELRRMAAGCEKHALELERYHADHFFKEANG